VTASPSLLPCVREATSSSSSPNNIPPLTIVFNASFPAAAAALRDTSK
jgi:hypothetical protein